MRSKLFSVLGLILFALSATGFAQLSSRLTGTVLDQQGARIPNVEITITNVETGVVETYLTNDSGIYGVNVLPGTYEITAELDAFRTEGYENVVVRPTDTLSFDFTMELATAGDEVNVFVDARDRVSFDNASVGTVLDGDFLTQLPLVGGDVLDLVDILPGSRQSPAGPQFDTFAGVAADQINTVRDGLSVSDGRFPNGIFGTTLINPDLVQEVRLILTPVDAEMGRGNGQVIVTTRSGTNQYRGTATWNIRNSALDSNSWSANNRIVNGVWSPETSEWTNNNQVTIAYGGPIIQNKTFFYALFDKNFNNSRELISTTVLTETARHGIFRYWEDYNPVNFAGTNSTNNAISVDNFGNPVAPLYDQGTIDPMTGVGTPFSGNLYCMSVFGDQRIGNLANNTMVPFTDSDCVFGSVTGIALRPSEVTMGGETYWDVGRSTIDPTGLIGHFMDLMPMPNRFDEGGDGLNEATHRWLRGKNFTFPGVTSGQRGTTTAVARKQINVKIDQNFSQNHKLNAGITVERTAGIVNTTYWPNGTYGDNFRRPWVLTTNFTSTLSPTIVNEARFGWRYTSQDTLQAWQRNGPVGDLAREFVNYAPDGTPILFWPNDFTGPDSLYCGPTSCSYGGSRSPLYSFGDTLRWTQGTHAFSFGAELRLTRSEGWNGLPGWEMIRLQGGEGEVEAAGIIQDNGLTGLRDSGGGTNGRAKDLLYTLSGSIDTGVSGSPFGGATSNQLYWVDSEDDLESIDTWESWSTSADTDHLKIRNAIQNEMSTFFKDDWKLLPSLTLNLGVRWEWYGIPYFKSGFTSAMVDQGDGLFGVSRQRGQDPFDTWLVAGANPLYLSGYGNGNTLACTQGLDPGNALLPVSTCDATQESVIEFVGPNTNQPEKSIYPQDLNNFGPAIGFAWQVPWWGRGRTTLRGGYQVTFGGSGRDGASLEGNTTVNVATVHVASLDLAQNYPNEYIDLTRLDEITPIPPQVAPGGDFPNVWERGLGVNQTATGYDPNFATPYVQNFNLSVTRQLNRLMTVDVRYVGTQSRKRNGVVNPNLSNAWKNPEFVEALNITRNGGDAVLFDQMLAGVDMQSGFGSDPNYTAVGTLNGNDVLVTGSASIRREFPTQLANGDYDSIANSLNTASAISGGNAGGVVPGSQLNTSQGTLLRNGCDRIAQGLTTVMTVNGPVPLRCFPENYFVANPQLANNTEYHVHGGSSNYHSGQFQFSLRPTYGTQFTATYTWSKGMEVPVNGIDPWDTAKDYTVSFSSQTHTFNANGVFQLPMGPGQLLFGNSGGLAARLLEGWRMSWTYRASSGQYRSIDAQNMLYTGGTPDVVGAGWDEVKGSVDYGHDIGNVDLGGHYLGEKYFYTTDPQCASIETVDALDYSLTCTLNAITDADGNIVLQNPLPGNRGTLGQRTFQNPGEWQLNGALSKEFQIGETKRLQFRMDGRNILNHPTPNDASLNINSEIDPLPNGDPVPFATIGGKGGGARSFQAQLRLTF